MHRTRVAEGAFVDYPAMLQQAAFKSAMLVSAGIATAEAVLSRLCSVALSRGDRPPLPEAEVMRLIEAAFADELANPALDIGECHRDRSVQVSSL